MMRHARVERFRTTPSPALGRRAELRERRYSEGMERLGPTPTKEHKGRFSEGMELDDASRPLSRDTDA
jgi:hypothetical protein